MMKEAEDTGKWFFGQYHQLWFSPAELRAYWAEGRFRWGAVNWKLRDPAEREAELAAQLGEKQAELQRFRERGK